MRHDGGGPCDILCRYEKRARTMGKGWEGGGFSSVLMLCGKPQMEGDVGEVGMGCLTLLDYDQSGQGNEQHLG